MTDQMSLFPQQDDTPLFSGTPQRVKDEVYQPTETDAHQTQAANDNTVHMFDETIEAHGRTLQITRNGGRLVGEIIDTNLNPKQAARQWINEYFDGARTLDEWQLCTITEHLWYFTVKDGTSTYRLTYRRGAPGITNSTWRIARI